MVNKNYKRNQLQMGSKIDAFSTTLQALTLESFLKKEKLEQMTENTVQNTNVM